MLPHTFVTVATNFESLFGREAVIYVFMLLRVECVIDLLKSFSFRLFKTFGITACQKAVLAAY